MPVCNVVELVQAVLWQEEGGRDAVHRSIAPPFAAGCHGRLGRWMDGLLKEVAGCVQVIEVLRIHNGLSAFAQTLKRPTSLYSLLRKKLSEAISKLDQNFGERQSRPSQKEDDDAHGKGYTAHQSLLRCRPPGSGASCPAQRNPGGS
jgi:hypothetical protein